MSDKTDQLPKRGLSLAVVMMAGFLMFGFTPAQENAVQGPDFTFQVLCLDDNGQEMRFVFGTTGPINLKTVQAKDIGKTVKLCREQGTFKRVIPKSEDDGGGGGGGIIIG